MKELITREGKSVVIAVLFITAGLGVLVNSYLGGGSLFHSQSDYEKTRMAQEYNQADEAVKLERQRNHEEAMRKYSEYEKERDIWEANILEKQKREIEALDAEAARLRAARK